MDSNRLKVRFPLVKFVIVGKPVGETILYFGCRYEHLDFIYEDELQKYQDAGKISSPFILNSQHTEDACCGYAIFCTSLQVH